MKFKLSFVIIALLFLILISAGAYYIFSKDKSLDLFQSVILPIHPKGYNIQTGFSNKLNCKYAYYNVNINFPATDVVKYLVDKFKSMNVKRYSGDISGNMRWENYNYSTGNWEETGGVPARFRAVWTDENKEKLFLLVLFYKYNVTNKDNWENTLIVDCKVCPFSDLETARKYRPKIRKTKGSPLE